MVNPKALDENQHTHCAGCDGRLSPILIPYICILLALSVALAALCTPIVAIEAPDDGAQVAANQWVDVAFRSDTADRIVRLDLLLDGEVLQSYNPRSPSRNGEKSFPVDMSAVAAGRHRLTVRATDTAGETGSARITVYRRADDGEATPAPTQRPQNDRIPPSIRITFPAHGANLAGQVKIRAQVQDDTSVKSVTFYIDGKLHTIRMNTPPFEADWDTTACEDGPHIIEVRATDDMNNEGTSAPLTVITANQGASPGETGVPQRRPGTDSAQPPIVRGPRAAETDSSEGTAASTPSTSTRQPTPIGRHPDISAPPVADVPPTSPGRTGTSTVAPAVERTAPSGLRPAMPRAPGLLRPPAEPAAAALPPEPALPQPLPKRIAQQATSHRILLASLHTGRSEPPLPGSPAPRTAVPPGRLSDTTGAAPQTAISRTALQAPSPGSEILPAEHQPSQPPSAQLAAVLEPHAAPPPTGPTLEGAPAGQQPSRDSGAGLAVTTRTPDHVARPQQPRKPAQAALTPLADLARAESPQMMARAALEPSATDRDDHRAQPKIATPGATSAKPQKKTTKQAAAPPTDTSQPPSGRAQPEPATTTRATEQAEPAAAPAIAGALDRIAQWEAPAARALAEPPHALYHEGAVAVAPDAFARKQLSQPAPQRTPEQVTEAPVIIGGGTEDTHEAEPEAHQEKSGARGLEQERSGGARPTHAARGPEKHLRQLTGADADSLEDAAIAFNGNPLPAAALPRRINGALMAPLKYLFAEAGGTVYWFPEHKRVRAIAPNADLTVQAGSLRAKLNGNPVQMQTEPVTQDGRLFVPVEIIQRALGVTFKFEPAAKKVIIQH